MHADRRRKQAGMRAPETLKSQHRKNDSGPSVHGYHRLKFNETLAQTALEIEL
jgi:hypothetical protein